MSKIIALKKLIDNHFEKLEELINDNDKTLYIYTTGIADWGRSGSVINIWKDCRYVNIIKQICFYGFKHIIIKHYDPLLDINDQIKTDFINLNELKELKELKVQTEQIFKKEYFDFSSLKETKKHYIIFDFAHVFDYFYNKDDKNYYMRKHKEIPLGKEDPEPNPDENDAYSKTHYKEIYNLNCIYINYPTTQFKCDIYWEENIKYFLYDIKNKKITSYIELLFKALSDETNYNYLFKDLKIDINNSFKGNIINYYNLRNLNDFLHKIFYEKQIYIYMRKKKNILPDDEIDNMKTKIDPNKLYINFFNKLLNNDNTNIFNIESYSEYSEYKQENPDKI